MALAWVNLNCGIPPHTLQIGKCLSSLPPTNNAMSPWNQKKKLWVFVLPFKASWIYVVSRQLRQVGRKEGEAEEKKLLPPPLSSISLYNQSRFLNRLVCNCPVTMPRKWYGKQKVKTRDWHSSLCHHHHGSQPSKAISRMHEIPRNTKDQSVYKNKTTFEIQRRAVVTFDCSSWMSCTAFFQSVPKCSLSIAHGNTLKMLHLTQQCNIVVHFPELRYKL